MTIPSTGHIGPFNTGRPSTGHISPFNLGIPSTGHIGPFNLGIPSTGHIGSFDLGTSSAGHIVPFNLGIVSTDHISPFNLGITSTDHIGPFKFWIGMQVKARCRLSGWTNRPWKQPQPDNSRCYFADYICMIVRCKHWVACIGLRTVCVPLALPFKAWLLLTVCDLVLPKHTGTCVSLTSCLCFIPAE